MTRENKARIATIAILAGALVMVAARRVTWPSLASVQVQTPQDTIYRMLDAARDGDVQGYLNCYTGEMETSLRQIVKEKGRSAMADYIRGFNASVNGVAIQEPQTVAENEVRVKAEFVYRDRNESQVYYFQRSARRWRIEREENAHDSRVIVPYGTRVE